MRGLWTLVRTEWRGARWLTAACAALAVGATIALNEFFVHYRDGELSAVWVLPVLAGLYLAMLASDLVAADVATRRIDALALLPVRLHVVWCAKLAFLALAGVAFTLWAVATQMAVLHFGGVSGQVGAFLAALPGSLPHFGIAIALAGATLLFSTLLERSFAAVLAGALVVGGLVVAWKFVDWFALDLHVPIGDAAWVTLGVAVVLVAAAGISFVRTPIQSGTRVRRALLAGGVVAAVFVPAGTASAWALDRWMSLEPGDPDAFVEYLHTSPDGRRVALQVGKVGRHGIGRVWVLRVADRALAPLPESAVVLRGWEGGAVLAGAEKSVRSDGLVRWYDAASGAVTRTRSFAQWQQERDAAPADPVLQAHRRFRLRYSGQRMYVEWPERGVEREFPTACRFAAVNWESGRVISWPQTGRAVLTDLATGREDLLGEGVRWARFLAHGERVVLGLADRLVVVDVARGTRTEWPSASDVTPLGIPLDRGLFATQAPGRIRIHDATGATLLELPSSTRAAWPLQPNHLLVTGPTRIVDLATRRARELTPDPADHGYVLNLVRPLPDGRTVFAAGSRVMLLDADGTTTQLVDLARDER